MRVLRANRLNVLALVVLISVGARLVIASTQIANHPERSITRDSVAYVNSASVLRSEHRFGVSPEFAATPQTVLVPGYPLFLMLLNAVTLEKAAWAAVVQSLIGGLTIFIIYLMSLEIGSSESGVFAAGFLAFNPNSMGISLFVLSETLFTFLLVGAVYLLFVSQKQTRGVPFLAAAGMMLGVATLTRAIAHYLGLLIFIWILVYTAQRHKSIRVAARHSVTFLAAFMVLVGGWSYRNWSVTGSWGLSQIEGIDLLFFRAADVVASVDGTSLSEARTKLAGGADYHALRRMATANPQLGLSGAWRERAVEIILDHPFIYSRRVIRYSIVMMIGPGDGWLAKTLFSADSSSGPFGDWNRLSLSGWIHEWLMVRTGQGLLFLYSSAYLVVLYSLVLASGAVIFRGRSCRGFVLLMCIIIAYFIIASAGPEAYFRYRVPVEPFLCLLGGIGWVGVTKTVTGAVRRQASGA